MPELFEGRRVMVHINGGKLSLDPKTEKKRWKINFVVSLQPADVHTCHPAIVSNYQQIEAPQNSVEKIEIGLTLGAQAVDLFGLASHTAPALRLGRAVIDDLKMLHADGTTTLEFKAETDCTRAVHDFVRDYVFTTVWAEFAPVQQELPMAVEISVPTAAKPKGIVQ